MFKFWWYLHCVLKQYVASGHEAGNLEKSKEGGMMSVINCPVEDNQIERHGGHWMGGPIQSPTKKQWKRRAL